MNKLDEMKIKWIREPEDYSITKDQMKIVTESGKDL